MKDLTIKIAHSPADQALCREVRREVFIEEQGVPASIEIDEYEDKADHFLALLGGKPVGAGRMRIKKSYAKFERIATLKVLRGTGIGRQIMELMQKHARRSYPEYLPAMHAQQEAVGFYEKLGWIAVGDTFYEANIPHRVLILPPEDQSVIKRLRLWQDSEVREDIKAYLRTLGSSATS